VRSPSLPPAPMLFTSDSLKVSKTAVDVSSMYPSLALSCCHPTPPARRRDNTNRRDTLSALDRPSLHAHRYVPVMLGGVFFLLTRPHRSSRQIHDPEQTGSAHIMPTSTWTTDFLTQRYVPHLPRPQLDADTPSLSRFDMFIDCLQMHTPPTTDIHTPESQHQQHQQTMHTCMHGSHSACGGWAFSGASNR